jgi:hypothetical protein
VWSALPALKKLKKKLKITHFKLSIFGQQGWQKNYLRTLVKYHLQARYRSKEEKLPIV